MCRRLVQEYRIWLGEILEVLQNVYENVVPAGRLEEDIYWKTKSLQAIKYDQDSEWISELLRYAQEGRKLIAPVKEEMKTLNGEYSEESQFRLRRICANQVLNSLQMLVNFYFAMKEYLKYAGEEACLETDVMNDADKCFEVDASDEVRRVRSGVCVIKGVCPAEQGVAAVSEGKRNRRLNWNSREHFAHKHAYTWKTSVAG